jgi:3-oxoacyl-[acyl-carrier-protein] synthase-3
VRGSRIIGTGSYLPSRIVGNEEVSRSLSLDAAAIERRTGIKARRWVADDQAASDLAEQAARQACDAAGIAPDSLDAILVSTTSPDMAFPSTACLIQSRLQAKHAAAFDVAASCSGFLYGLSMADALIKSGQARRCLVAAAEVKSRFLDPTDEATAILFGDGAGAAVVETCDAAGPAASGILGVRLHADGSRYGMIGMAAGGSRKPASAKTVRAREHAIHIQGVPLYRVAVKRLAEAVTDTLKEFGVSVRDVARVVFHQANGRLLATVLERLQIPPDRMYAVLDRFGNASSASLPIALDCAAREGKIVRGDLVLLGTFGGGLTWGTALVRW